MINLDGKVIIVTGGAQGIGLGLSLHFAKRGANVAIAEIDPTSLDAAVADLRGQGLDVFGVETDVARRDQTDAAVAAVVDRYGRIDGLVNNAQGFVNGVRFEDLTEEHFGFTWETGALGAVRFMQSVFPVMKEQRSGSIVNVTSAGALIGSPLLGAYNTTKGAMISVTRSAATEWGQYGIRVNAYGPYALTQAWRNWHDADPEAAEKSLEAIPLGRLGDPETDIAPAVAFFFSDDARYVTGQLLLIDGGTSIMPA